MSELNQWNAQLYDKSFSYIQNMAFELIDRLSPEAGERIIDLGCGTGLMTNEIRKKGALVEGLDNDPAMIQLARERYPYIKFMCLSAAEFRTDVEYDAIFSNAALHWMKQPDLVINRIANALKPGGRFVGEMGGAGNVDTLIKSLFQALAEIGISRDEIDFPWYFPNVDEYTKLLEKGGFRVDFIQLFSRPTPLDDCANGASDWYKMFADQFLACTELKSREAVINRATYLAGKSLCKDGRWFADYTRLRFEARMTIF